MARTRLKSLQINDNTITSGQIIDGAVTRSDLNTSTSGSAVIRKLVQGTGLSISSTGADSGTGDVTVNLGIASASALGGVKIGSGISISADGTISASASGGTVTSVSGTGTVSGLTLSGTVTSSGSLTLGGTLSLTSAQVTTALGFTPYNATNPNGYITGITSSMVTTALGYTPYNSSNPSGYQASSGVVARIGSRDNRTISPSSDNAYELRFGFTSFSNNNTSPWADYLHLRSYSDNSGGNDNLVVFRKDTIGMRIYQQTFGSSTAYTTFKDVAFTDSSITGNAATATTLQNSRTINGTSFNGSANITTASWGTARTITIGSTGKSVDGSGNVSWTLAEIGAQAAGSYAAATHTHAISDVTGLQAALDGKQAAGSYAAASHTHDDRYYTESESDARFVALVGSTMTGNINWATNDRGITWGMNTDGAYIKFFNTGDGDTNSRLEYSTSDNGDEFHRWLISSVEEMTLKSDGLRVTDSIWMGGRLVATQDWVTSQSYAASSHTHSNATTSAAGFMSAADKSKLDGIAAGATANAGTVTSVSGTGTVSGITLSGTVTSSGSLTLGGSLSLTSAQVTTALGYTPYNATNPNGYTSNTGTVTSVSGTGSVNGLTLSGTVTSSGNLTLSGSISASIDNITDEPRIFNNMGQNHGTRSSFDASTPSYDFGWRFIQGNANGPGVNSATQYYSLYIGLGNDYAATGAGSYGLQLAIPRDVTTPYLAIRYNENNSLRAWQKISAGYADSAGSVAWTNVSGRPTAVSSFSNDSGYITSSGSISGNAGSATVLQTARTLTIGNTGKTFNGSANVSWSLAEIGAQAAGSYAAASHTHTPSEVGLGNVSNVAQVTTTNNSSLNSDSRNTRGVTRLYRRDDNSDYSVQTYWTGSYWRLYGYNGDSGHADTHVGYSDSSGYASSAGSASSVAWTNVSGRPTNVSSFTNDSGYITSSGSISGSAGSVAWGNITGRPSWMTSSSLVASHSNANDWRNSGFYENDGGGSNWPSQTWYNSINVRHSNQGNYHGFQIAMSYYDNLLWFRSYQGSGTFQSWVYAISSANIGSQSVNYANSAGSVAWANVSSKPGNLTYWDTWYGSAYLGSDGNLYMGWAGAWLSSWLNQGVRTDSAPTFQEVYTNGWFRNNNSNQGLYNQSTTMHWSSRENGYWDASSTTSVSSIRFYTGGHVSSLRGYVYANTSNEIGFLNSGGSWSLRCDNSGNVTATGDLTAYSDARLKTNVNTIDKALDKVLQMRGVTYVRTDNNDTAEKIGVIAQEMQQVLPQVVQENSDGFLTVSYGNIVGVLIEAIKEQQKEIETLKSRLA